MTTRSPAGGAPGLPPSRRRRAGAGRPARPRGAQGAARTAGRPAHWLILAAAAAALTAVGCGGRPPASIKPVTPAPGTSLPVSAAPTASPRPRPGPRTPRQAVLAVYRGYWRAIAKAQAERSPARARRILSPYLPAANIRSFISSQAATAARGQLPYGHAVPHVLAVDLAGATARVHDCVDLSHTGLMSARTRRPIAGTAGRHRLNLVTRLARAHGRWEVTGQTEMTQPCAP
jgi:hypothetical protein